MKKTVHKKKKKVSHHHSYSSKKEDRGLSKIILVAVLAIVLAGAGGAYVLSQKAGVALPSVPFLKPALNPNCAFNDPELCKFMNNSETKPQTNLKVTTTSTMGGMSMESIYETAGDGKTHMVSKQNGKESTNAITIGDTTYTFDYSDSKWWKQTYSPDKSKDTQVNETKDKMTMDITPTPDNTKYKFVVKEACGDKMCFKYEIVSPDSTDSKQYIWFDDQEYLMRKIRIEDKSGGSSDSVYTYGGVSIVAPSPVKEGTPGESSMNPEVMQKMMQQYQQQAPATGDTSNQQEQVPQEDTSSDN